MNEGAEENTEEAVVWTYPPPPEQGDDSGDPGSLRAFTSTDRLGGSSQRAPLDILFSIPDSPHLTLSRCVPLTQQPS